MNTEFAGRVQSPRVPPSPSCRNVVIVGGGFAGTRAAQILGRRLPPDCTVTLLDQENFITFSPLLPEVVGASLPPGHVVAPHRQMIRRGHVRMVRVVSIDAQERLIHCEGAGPGVIQYDQLVMTCGARANLQAIEGMAEHGMALKTLGDALHLRNHIVRQLEEAELAADEASRRWLMTFIVVGGGFSGVETAGELVDFLHASLRYYRRIRPEDLRVILLHATERLLPELPASLSAFTLRKMRRRGIEVRLKISASCVSHCDVRLSTGEVVSGGTVICTVRTAANRLLDDIPAPKARGRLLVLSDLSVPGVEGVWAAGDCAAVPNARDGAICPPTAQFANAQARQLAHNLIARLNGRSTRSFNFRPRGQLSSVGHNKAVADIFGFRISGFMAWLLWRGVYLLRIPTLARKVRVFLEWNWGMLFPPDIAHLSFPPHAESEAEPPEPVHAAAHALIFFAARSPSAERPSTAQQDSREGQAATRGHSLQLSRR